MKVDRRVGRSITSVKSDRDQFSLDLRRIKGTFARFKQSLEVHWLSISLGYNLTKAYWPLVRCSRLFSLPASFSLISTQQLSIHSL